MSEEMSDEENMNVGQHEAAINGELEKLQKLVKDYSPDILNVEDEMGRNTIFHATNNDDLEMVKYISKVCPEALYNYDDEKRSSVSHLAAFSAEGVHILEFLLYDNKVFNDMCEKDNIENILYWRDRYGNTPLHIAVEENNYTTAKFLLSVLSFDAFFEKNMCQELPLHIAAKIGSYKMVDMFLQYANNMSIHYEKNILLNEPLYNQDGETIAQIVCDRGYYEIAKLIDNICPEIFSLCATNHHPHYGGSPLHSACFNGNVDICIYLIQRYPVMCEFVDNFGSLPVHDTMCYIKSKGRNSLLILQTIYTHNPKTLMDDGSRCQTEWGKESFDEDDRGTSAIYAVRNGNSLSMMFLLEKMPQTFEGYNIELEIMKAIQKNEERKRKEIEYDNKTRINQSDSSEDKYKYYNNLRRRLILTFFCYINCCNKTKKEIAKINRQSDINRRFIYHTCLLIHELNRDEKCISLPINLVSIIIASGKLQLPLDFIVNEVTEIMKEFGY